MYKPLALILGLSVLGAGCDRGGETVASLGTLEKDRIELTAESSEAVVGVFVQEGDVVLFDSMLIQQDTARAEAALVRARADEAVARSALVEAEAGPRQQQIAAARARLEAASSALNTSRLELNRMLSLIERKLASDNQGDVLKGRYDEALARVSEANASLDQMLEGTRSEEIDQVRSRHAAARATVRDLEITLDRATTRAPIAGIIEALPFEIGERPNPGATVVVLLATGRTFARIHVSEPLRTRLKVGSAAEIHLDGWPEPLPGKLRWIATTAAFTPYYALNQHDGSRLSYLAEVDVDPGIENLPVGVPVEVVFPGLVE